MGDILLALNTTLLLPHFFMQTLLNEKAWELWSLTSLTTLNLYSITSAYCNQIEIRTWNFYELYAFIPDAHSE